MISIKIEIEDFRALKSEVHDMGPNTLEPRQIRSAPAELVPCLKHSSARARFPTSCSRVPIKAQYRPLSGLSARTRSRVSRAACRVHDNGLEGRLLKIIEP